MTEESLDEKFTRLHTYGTENIEYYTDRFNFNKLLDLYANWRRALDGPISTPRPEGMPGKEHYKWDRWNSLTDKSVDDCKRDYVALIESMNVELIRLGVMEATEESDPL